MNLTLNQRKALNIDEHICVTAGAGSGKTTVLVDRYLNILKEGRGCIAPRDIVAITFTDKAAAEMKGRIIEQLTDAADIDGRDMFLEEMNVAPISTIHAFCLRILREFPFQAGVPANFSIIQGIDQKLLMKQTLHNSLREIATDPTHRLYDDLRISLQRYGNRKGIVDLLTIMIDKRDVIEQVIRNVYSNQNGSIPEPWISFYLANLPSETEVIEYIDCIDSVLEVARGKNVTEVRILISKLDLLPDSNPVSPGVLTILKDIAVLITNKDDSIGKGNFLGRGADATSLEDEIEVLVSVSKRIKGARIPDAEDTETDDHYLVSTTHHLLRLYEYLLDQYNSAKLLQGLLDYNDLQLKTRDLLKDSNEIRETLLERYKYYMIDEYQDTNEVQYDLVMLLTNKLQNANLFIVGDPKQSIYGFRGADVRVFDRTKQQIIDNGGLDIKLTENFRSLRDSVGVVNHFFQELMGDGSQNEYEVAFEPLIQARDTNGNGAVEIILGNKNNEEGNEALIIAHHINSMIANNVQIWEKNESGNETSRPIKYGDIAILIRNRNHLSDLEKALLNANIPHLITGGVGFYQRQEIYDIWNYLNFLDAPEKHDSSLIGILRGPTYGISDTELYEISRQKGTSLWNKLSKYSSPSDQLKQANVTINNHLQYAHRMPVNRLIHTIVNETGLIGTLNIGKQGQQRWANYQKLLDLARDYDSDENKQTLSDFIEFLDILINEEPLEGQAPIENTSGSIEIMTIHSAKGKQFPVVILPFLNRGSKPNNPPFIDEKLGIGFNPYEPEDEYANTKPEITNQMKERATEKDEAEKKRIFYVGATRATDRLILSGSLNHNNKLDNMQKWLYDYLGIDIDADSYNTQVSINIYRNDKPTNRIIDLHIPIIKQIASTEDANMLTEDLETVEFPKLPIVKLNPSTIDSSVSIEELADFSRCPLCYQLKHLLKLPQLEGRQTQLQEMDIDDIIRNVLAKVKHVSNSHRVDTFILQALDSMSNLTDDSSISENLPKTREHVNNILNSQIGRTALQASDSNINHHIYADINGHVISGSIDRLYKDQTGLWQGLNYTSCVKGELDYYMPEMELLGLLMHKSYPTQHNITISYYLTKLNQCLSKSFRSTEFQDIIDRCINNITSLQMITYTNEFTHSSSCQYADSEEQYTIN